ncbi:serine hydrolase domain-containing protein [Roseateles microcysteis]|uniref:serine hydrolase domain-containing protein n=1 Tax=Roseateles microcysteis TaxID=3119057 RepID=UPI002FE5272F
MAAPSTSARSTVSAESSSLQRRALLLSSLGLALPAGASVRQLDHRARLWAFEQQLPALMTELKVPGLALLLLQDGQPAWSACQGHGGGAEKKPVGPSTVFELASMSKPVFAWLAMQLVRSGQLQLDRPIVEILPRPFETVQAGQERITPRMLLSHQSGLPNWRAGGDDAPLLLQAVPGERFIYSGEGYYLLQQLVEKVTGLPLQALAERELFKPLGMDSSTFVWRPTLDARRAWGHDDAGLALPRQDYARANSAYTLYSSLDDYGRFLAAMLKPDFGSAMLVPQVKAGDREPLVRPEPARGREVNWGLGWVLDEAAQGRIAYHSGSNSTGYRSYCQFSVQRGSALLMLSNGLGGGKLWRRLAATLGDL